VRDTVLKVKPRLIVDSAKATTINDTLIQYIRVVDKDTVVDIRYYPKPEAYFWKIQPDTVRITKRDTLVSLQIVEKTKDLSVWVKLGIGAVGAIIGALILIFVKSVKDKV